MDDPWDSEEVEEWKRHVKEKVVTMIDNSSVVVSLAPPKEAGPDIKFCVELGLAIMLDKPIHVVAAKREDVPSKLWFLADSVTVGSIDDPAVRDKLMKEIKG